MRAGQLPYGDSSEPGQAVLANNLILLKTRHNAATQYPPPLCRWPGTAGMPTEFGYSRPQRLCAQLQDLPSYMHYHVGKRMSGIGCPDKIVIRRLEDPTFRCIVKHREHSRPRIWAATMLAANSGSSPPYSKLRPLRGSRARLIPPANMTLKPLRLASSPIIRAATSHIQIDIATRPNSIGRRSRTRRQWAMSRPNTDPDAAYAPHLS